MGDIVLYVEDDAVDAFFLRRALTSAGWNCRLIHLDNGQSALDYLSGVGEYRDRSRWPRPHLVLLDLKVPLVDGLEILEWVRRHPALADLPVFVLTSSDEAKEQRRAFELGVSGYFLKTATFEGLPAQIRRRLAALRAFEEEEPGRALKGLAA